MDFVTLYPLFIGILEMADRKVYLVLSFRQGRWLLKFLDALMVAFGANTPDEVRSIYKLLHTSMYPDQI